MAADYLTGLLARREELVEQATADLEVPRWDNPKLVLRVRPVDEVLIGEGDGQARVKLYDLKESLGFDPDEKVDASRLIRTLCITDGDVMSLAQAVVEHSGYKQASVDEALAGE
jgi:hypothetical protein